MTPEELAARTQAWREAAVAFGPQSYVAQGLRPARDHWMREARREGMTYRTVAEAVGGVPNGLLTGERVRQICNDTERTTQ